MVQQSIRMVYCIPLRKRAAGTDCHEKDILGVLYLDSRLQPGKLSQVDNDLLETISTEAAALVENAFLAQAEESARRYREELNIAAAIQQGLMEFAIPNLPYARVHARSVACKDVGGDFYDVIATPDGLYIVIADISGKGVSAAILASTLQGLLYGLLLAGQPLARDRGRGQSLHLREKCAEIRHHDPGQARSRRDLRICQLRACSATAGQQPGR